MDPPASRVYRADERVPSNEVVRMIQRAIAIERARQSSQKTTSKSQNYDDTEAEANHVLQPEDEDPTPFRFLDFPPELRNKVYDYHLQDYDRFYLIKRKRGKEGRVVLGSNLRLTCREIEEEITTMLTKTALVNCKKLVCKVSDFNFKPTIATLQWLVESTNKPAPGNEAYATIQLSISAAWPELSCFETLPKWYKWINANSKQGIGVQIDYVIGDVKNMQRAYDFLRDLCFSDNPSPPHELVRIGALFEAWNTTRYGKGSRVVTAQLLEKELQESIAYIDSFGDVFGHEDWSGSRF